MNEPAQWLYAPSSRACTLVGLISLVFCLFLGTPTQAYAQSYQLTVNGGSGGGLYAPSSLVRVSAFPYDTSNPAVSTGEPLDPAAPVRIFDQWTGATELLADVWAKDTTLVMPANDVTITAQFKDVPRWELPRIMSYFPENPVGVLYLLHGTGGSLAYLLSSLEVVRFVDQAKSRRFAVVMIESYDRKECSWDTTHLNITENIDMQRLAEVHKQLSERGKILPGCPVYCVGISQGGVFASIVAAQAGVGALPFNVKAMAAYISPGNREAMTTTLTPTIFFMAQNDDIIDNSLVLSNFDLLISRDIATQVWTLEPTPVNPDKFWGIQGLSQTDSQTLQSQLKVSGMLDLQDCILNTAFQDLNSDGMPDWMASIPVEYDGFLTEINNQLLVAHAGHTFFSNLNDKTFTFFANPTTIISPSPEITGFSPITGGVGDTITVAGNNFVAIQSVTFNNTPAYAFVVTSPTTLLAIVAASTTNGPIRVTNPAGTAVSPGGFTVTGYPVITGFTPSMGGVGQMVTITGQNFVKIDTVTFFNGKSALEFQLLSQTSLIVKVPAGAETGKISVGNWLGTSVSEAPFTILVAPNITAFTPTSGSVGSLIAITGTGFTGTTGVKFGAISAQFAVASDTLVNATVPAGVISSCKIAVVNPAGVATSSTRFRVK